MASGARGIAAHPHGQGSVAATRGSPSPSSRRLQRRGRSGGDAAASSARAYRTATPGKAPGAGPASTDRGRSRQSGAEDDPSRARGRGRPDWSRCVRPRSGRRDPAAPAGLARAGASSCRRRPEQAYPSLGMGRAGRARYPEAWGVSRPCIGPVTPSTPCSIRSSPSTWRPSCARGRRPATEQASRSSSHLGPKPTCSSATACWPLAPGGAAAWSPTDALSRPRELVGERGGSGPGSGRGRETDRAALLALGGPHAPGLRHRRAGVSKLWGPSAPDRHHPPHPPSRRHPGDPRSPGPLPLRAESRPRPTRAQRRRALISSVRGAADAVVPARRHETPSAVARPVRLPLDGGAAPR
jgi:hypothetical protein